MKLQYIVAENNSSPVPDRAYIKLNGLESALGDHPVILIDKDIKTLYDKISSLSDLYQKLGQVNFEK